MLEISGNSDLAGIGPAWLIVLFLWVSFFLSKHNWKFETRSIRTFLNWSLSNELASVKTGKKNDFNRKISNIFSINWLSWALYFQNYQSCKCGTKTNSTLSEKNIHLSPKQESSNQGFISFHEKSVSTLLPAWKKSEIHLLQKQISASFQSYVTCHTRHALRVFCSLSWKYSILDKRAHKGLSKIFERIVKDIQNIILLRKKNSYNVYEFFLYPHIILYMSFFYIYIHIL